MDDDLEDGEPIDEESQELDITAAFDQDNPLLSPEKQNSSRVDQDIQKNIDEEM